MDVEREAREQFAALLAAIRRGDKRAIHRNGNAVVNAIVKLVKESTTQST